MIKINHDENTNHGENKEQKTRRGFFVGMVSGLVVSAMLGKSKTARADVVGTDTTAITGLWVWLKAEYVIIAPYIKAIKDNYDAVKGYVSSFNAFVSDFNGAMSWMQQAKVMLTEPQQNIFYQQYRQIAAYIDGIVKQKDNDLLSFRLHYFNPVLINKIDSMTGQIEGMYARAKNLVKKFDKSGMKFDPKVDPIRQTKEGKAAIRASNDQAKYVEAISKLYAIKDSKNEIQNTILKEYIAKNKTEKNSMEIYNEMLFPKVVDILLLQTSIQAEMYQKMNDFFMLFCKEDPIISDNERFVSRSEIKILMDQLKVSGSSNNSGSYLA